MDIWERLYIKAKEQYHPEDVSPFVYAHHVVCALEVVWLIWRQRGCVLFAVTT